MARPTLIVVEDPQTAELRGHPPGDRLVVVVGDSEQHQHPRADRGQGLIGGPDRGRGDPLDQRAHEVGAQEPASRSR